MLLQTIYKGSGFEVVKRHCLEKRCATGKQIGLFQTEELARCLAYVHRVAATNTTSRMWRCCRKAARTPNRPPLVPRRSASGPATANTSSSSSATATHRQNKSMFTTPHNTLVRDQSENQQHPPTRRHISRTTQKNLGALPPASRSSSFRVKMLACRILETATETSSTTNGSSPPAFPPASNAAAAENRPRRQLFAHRGNTK